MSDHNPAYRDELHTFFHNLETYIKFESRFKETLWQHMNTLNDDFDKYMKEITEAFPDAKILNDICKNLGLNSSDDIKRIPLKERRDFYNELKLELKNNYNKGK